MFQRIETTGQDIVALELKGEITSSDYTRTLLPTLDMARSQGEKIRFLFHVGPEYQGFTFGAGWEDLKLGFRHMSTIERIAVVSDIKWIRDTTHVFGSLLACPVQVFENSAMGAAGKWLDSGEIGLDHHLDTTNGVLRVEISGPLTSLDFDVLTVKVDDWIASNGVLSGLVIHVKKFPGWEDFGSLVSHITFIKDLHRKIKRVALSVDGELPNIAASVLKHFVGAEVKVFSYDNLSQALTWAEVK